MNILILPNISFEWNHNQHVVSALRGEGLSRRTSSYIYSWLGQHSSQVAIWTEKLQIYGALSFLAFKRLKAHHPNKCCKSFRPWWSIHGTLCSSYISDIITCYDVIIMTKSRVVLGACSDHPSVSPLLVTSGCTALCIFYNFKMALCIF